MPAGANAGPAVRRRSRAWLSGDVAARPTIRSATCNLA